MKKPVVLLLIALLVVGLFVSCNDEPQKAKATEMEAKNVVEATLDSFLPYIQFARRLVVDNQDPDTVKANMKTSLEAEYEFIYGETVTVTPDASNDSLSANVVIEDTEFNETLEMTNLKYSPSEKIISGNLSLDYTSGDEELPISIEVKCVFAFSFANADANTITFSYVKFCGKEYELDAFNEKMAAILEELPFMT